MYGLIQKHKQLAALIIAVASISFLFWMFSIGDIKQMFGMKKCVALVEDECITFREFRYELLKYRQFVEDESLLPILKRRVINDMILNKLLYKKSLEEGIVASDREVADFIKSDKNFFENGAFSLSSYKDFLDRVGLTPAEYESYVKEILTVRKFTRFFGLNVYITKDEVSFGEDIASMRFEGNAYLIDRSAVKVKDPSLEELKEFYSKNKEMFKVGERRIYRVWSIEDKGKAHRIYSGLKKGEKLDGGKVYTTDDVEGLPAEVRSSLSRLSEKDRQTIIKIGNVYYVLFLERVEKAKVKDFESAKEEVRKAYLDMLKSKGVEKLALDVRKKLEAGKPVKGVRRISFSRSSVEEFEKLFSISDKKDVVEMVFSDKRVFGPYRANNSYVVLEIKRRYKDKEKSGDGVAQRLKQEKTMDLFGLYMRSIYEKAKIDINQEYLK